ncbi:MAG: LysM peptidoglycan-binding domain-containing protein [Nitrospirae bacterium]|nr:LysM peptidoglycan-binding domain-containing protein [Nitrospirota bacterium]NTW67297.1 LysM peptidoglycan-binding domain-containing protein [Nitrospirota bacterium]
MTSRSNPSVRAIRSALILLVITLLPATAWLQEPAAVTPAPPQEPAAAGTQSPAAEQTGRYEIRQGDTLWDIANAFYRDPFLWPLIWKSNPSISDPDLIYPGTALVIPSLAPIERAMSAPEEAAPVQETIVQEKAVEKPAAAAPLEETGIPSFFRQKPAESAEPEALARGSKLIVPEEAATPVIDKYAMLSAGFVSEESSQDYLRDAVVDPSRKGEVSNIIGADYEVYIVVRSREAVNIGDRFLIFEEVRKVKHPITHRDYGKLYKVNGVAKVTGIKEQGVYRARITLSFDAAMRGNMLAPYQEPTLIYPSKQKTEAKNLTGCILEVPDRKSISGQSDIVYLDKGKEDGVAPGDRFIVMSQPNPSTGVRHPVGEVLVIIVKARTATAFVQKSMDTLSKGYPVIFKN